MADETLDRGLVVTYKIILPILVVLGLVSSIGSIVVLSRPILQRAEGNKYFLALSLCDLFLCLSYIIIAVTACGCVFSTYASAWFFAHFGWTITCAFHALGTYIIIFMSLDRFVAVWFPNWYQPLTSGSYNITVRLGLAALLCFGLHVIYMIDAEVQCQTSLNSTDAVTARDSCTNGTYISNDGFQKSFEETWHVGYRYFYNVLVRWLPCALLIVLNFALVLAVATGKVKIPRAKNDAEESKKDKKEKKKNMQEKALMITAIVMTASYVLMTLPITIYLTRFAESSATRCVTPSGAETLRHVGNTFQLLEHLLHGIYLFFINPSFRRELLRLLQCQLSPSTESISDETPNQNSRPPSAVYSSSKQSRNSMVTTVSYKSFKNNQAAKESREVSKPLCNESPRETSEKSKSYSSDTAEGTLKDSASYYSNITEEALQEYQPDTTEEALQEYQPDTTEEALQETKSYSSDTAKVALIGSKSFNSDTAKGALEECQSFCRGIQEQTLTGTKSFYSDTQEEESGDWEQ